MIFDTVLQELWTLSYVLEFNQELVFKKDTDEIPDDVFTSNK